MESIRKKRGLAYSVSSGFEAGQFPGTFQVSLQTKNASAREAMSLVLKEIERIRTEPVTPEELDGAEEISHQEASPCASIRRRNWFSFFFWWSSTDSAPTIPRSILL